MGWFGITTGAITELVGIITDDDELKEKGVKRMGRGAATLIIGDVFGISDTVDVITSFTDSSGVT